MKRILCTAVVILSTVGFFTGCSAPKDTAATATPSEAVSGKITVFAAASLKSTFTALGAQLEKNNPATTVTFSFAGSSDLVSQLTQGAPADVFASADMATMTTAVDAGLVLDQPVNFASNTLEIVTPKGNPMTITSFADLAAPDVQVVVCAPQVPCGAATERIEEATGVELNPVSEESSVTDVLGKVASGQADGGLVYVTDAARAKDNVTAIPFPQASGAVNIYPIAVLKHSGNSETARKFVDLVTGPDGRRVLAEAGFAAP